MNKQYDSIPETAYNTKEGRTGGVPADRLTNSYKKILGLFGDGRESL